MVTATDILSSHAVTVDDFLPLTDLSVERAIDALPDDLRTNYSVAWNWFMDNSGTRGSRMYGERIPGVSENFALSAQRGIHVPAKTGIAVSVTVAQGSMYSETDTPLISLPDGTWILEYSAHRNNAGGKTDQRWNAGLFKCLELGLPVGVFIYDPEGGYLRYLAFVEEFHPDRNVFSLHGPVTMATASRFSSDAMELEVEDDDGNVRHYTAEVLEEDNRKFSTIQRAVRSGQGKFRAQLVEAYEGRCACSGCGVMETLQAAHIIAYRGNRSNIVSNGMLLRADLHLLFDNSLLTVDPSSFRFVPSKHLIGTDYEAYDNQPVRLPKQQSLWPSEEYLAAHFNRFKQLEMAPMAS